MTPGLSVPAPVDGSAGMPPAPQSSNAPDAARLALQAASEICRNHRIAALDDFLESCRAFAREEVLNVAVFGRFKAGKSSFLNHLIGRPLLPVGAVPVTAVVTEMEYGLRELAEVTFQDGHVETVSPESIGGFISETENPENCRRVSRVRLELPSMASYRGIRFVDTPGLESVLEHNTETSLDWLPNAGLAIVAVGVDPPLSRHDLDLIRRLGRYTPNISLLLTKIDLLEESDRPRVEDFVRSQLARCWDGPLPLFPYSTLPGFEILRERIDRELLLGARAEAGDRRAAILRHRIGSLLGECSGFLTLALKAAERDEAERKELRENITGGKQHLNDTRHALRLNARHAASTARAAFEEILRNDESPVRARLLAALEEQFRSPAGSLSAAAQRFEEWLAGAVGREMAVLSNRHREEFVEPIRSVGRQLSQALQDFRNRLSERALAALGVTLRTSEMELPFREPASPDVRIGKIFDRNWELLSFLLPMGLIRGVVQQHFRRRTADAVFTNLSRLATQWDNVVNGSIAALEKEAIRRLDRFAATIDTLVASAAPEAQRIRADLQRIEELRRSSCG